MQIQVNTDANIDGTESLTTWVSATLGTMLDRFSEHVTRVEVHLRDENGAKSGQMDQRCMLEARLEGRKPVAVTEHAATLDQAVHGAGHKLARLLDSTLGRAHDHRLKATDLPKLDGEPT